MSQTNYLLKLQVKEFFKIMGKANAILLKKNLIKISLMMH
jgi:hypothetical protein